jgi:hypothetical protein
VGQCPEHVAALLSGLLALAGADRLRLRRPGHGVERYIPVRYRYDDTHDRVVDLTDISGSSDSGAPVDLVRRTATISTCASATPTSW